jgi:carbonic anhydrase
LKPEAVAGMPAMQSWLKQAEPTRKIVEKNYSDLGWDDLLMATIQENVLAQLENLQAMPAIAARRSRGAVHLHGWVYQFETGSVFAYDPRQEEFVPLSSTQPVDAGPRFPSAI